MRLSLLSLTAAAGATAAVLAGPAAARAADAVYGGGSRTGDPIVVKADPDASELRSIVISYRAVCGDGRGFPGGSVLTPVKPVPGFSPSPSELLVSRNANGRFQGTRLSSADLGENAAAIVIDIKGRLKPKRATGTLSAVVKIMNKQTGAAVDSCQANQRWTASRQPGIVYGGSTSDGEPIVLRLNAQRKRVNDVLTTWHAQCTPSGGSYRIADHWGNFAVKRTGAFGNSFTDDQTMADGYKLHVDYDVAGKVSTKKASGRLQVKLAETDANGAATDSCDTGNVTWKAATG